MPKGQFTLSRRAQAAMLIQQEIFGLQRALRALRGQDKPGKAPKAPQGAKRGPKTA
jgi:hypothetical protein